MGCQDTTQTTEKVGALILNKYEKSKIKNKKKFNLKKNYLNRTRTQVRKNILN